MKKLCDDSNEAAWGMKTEFDKFSVEQKSNIIEVDSSGVDFSGLKTIGLGGVIGEFIDLSI